MTLQTQITKTLTEIILDLFEDAGFTDKYGGQLIEVVAGDPTSQIGGIFSYANHITVEFSKGAELADPNGVLEGKGKFRRHIKLQKIEDISAKNVRAMLQAAAEQLTA